MLDWLQSLGDYVKDVHVAVRVCAYQYSDIEALIVLSPAFVDETGAPACRLTVHGGPLGAAKLKPKDQVRNRILVFDDSAFVRMPRFDIETERANVRAPPGPRERR